MEDASGHETPAKAGTRFHCAECRAEFVVVKAPAGQLACCDRPVERLR